jgi:hypothetical protein
MTIKKHDGVVLAADLPNEGLKAGKSHHRRAKMVAIPVPSPSHAS